MATIKTDLICNLNQPVNVTYLHGNLFSQDNAGNTINVFVMDNGEPATIGGTVSANVIRSDGQTVAVSGAIEGNKAYVILPQACYAVPGVVHIIIKLTQNTTITTIAAIVANVYMSTTDAVIDPGTVIPSIQALMALIEEAVDSIPTDYTGLLHTIAADYSSSKTYKVGDYAWESGVLKRCIVPITAAETYTAAHWTNAVIGDDLTNLKSALTTVQSDALSPLLYNGFRKDGNGYYQADGTVIENSGWQYCSDFIPIAPNTGYTGWAYTTYMASQEVAVVWYTIDKTVISRSYGSTGITSPNNAYYCKISIHNTSDYAMFITGTTNPIYYIPFSIRYDNAEDSSIRQRLQDVSDSNLQIVGATYNYEDISVTESDGYINRYGILQTGNSWKHVEVNVEGGGTYYFVGSSASLADALIVFDDYHVIQKIPGDQSTASFAQLIKLPANAKKIIINKSATGIVLKKAISIMLESDENPDVLYGKKLYCGGDSITEGANVGTLPNGYKKTYGGYTATRNGMTYVSDGVGGSTMGKCTIDGSVHNNFITSRYTNIPTNANFITLWFGWNDNAYGWKSARDAYCVAQYGTYYSALTSAQQAEVDAYKTWRQWIDMYVGSIDSTDITTWSGAWNTVLTWLLNNCPSAHIGVVIAYGMQDALVTSLISICEKFGISYVKAYDPHEFFSVGHSTGIGTDQATKRKTLYTLDNTHPNELGYELMSTSFEQFIRRM